MDPNEHKRVGYLTSFDGLNLAGPLAQDLQVSLPYNNEIKYTDLVTVPGPTPAAPATGTLPPVAKVVGVLEQFDWDGVVGGPLKFDFWVSQENATLLKALQQQVLKTTKIKKLGFWVCDYDQETKMWYEAAFPVGKTTLTGLVAPANNPEMNVDLTPNPVKDGIDVMVYKVSIQMAPAANEAYMMSFANSSNKHVVKSWGLVVGTIAGQAMTT